MYNTQGMKHIQAIVDHGTATTPTGHQLQAILELHKVELGLGASFFTNHYDTFHHCATFTWVVWMWGFVWENKCYIEERTSNFKLQRVNDIFIMEALSTAGYK
eukprot:944302-Ditylum_brightwellii.AAC.1